MRLEGWETLLNEQIEKARHTPFKWGEHDCLTWACNCLLAITGVDYLADIRGRYKTKAGAYKLIKKQGDSLTDCIDQHVQRVSVKMAKRGDVVMYEGAVGICFGVQSFFITENQGLAGVPTLKCEMAWAV